MPLKLRLLFSGVTLIACLLAVCVLLVDGCGPSGPSIAERFEQAREQRNATEQAELTEIYRHYWREVATTCRRYPLAPTSQELLKMANEQLAECAKIRTGGIVLIDERSEAQKAAFQLVMKLSDELKYDDQMKLFDWIDELNFQTINEIRRLGELR